MYALDTHRPTHRPTAKPSRPKPLTGVLRRHPLAAFLAWFFTVGQALAFTPLVAGQAGLYLPHQPFVVLSTLVGMLLPALVITRAVDGPAAVRALLRSAVDVRAGASWYVLAIATVPLAATALTWAVLGSPPDSSPGAWAVAVLGGLVLAMVLNLVPNNLWEEVAWTGFFQSRLQRRYRPVVAAVVTAAFFALQHVSLAVGGTLLEAAAVILLLFVLAVPFRFLTGWTYNRTSSLFLVGVLHAVGNSVAGGSGFQQGMLADLYDGHPLAATSHLIAFFVIGLVVVAATHGRLGLPREQS